MSKLEENDWDWMQEVPEWNLFQSLTDERVKILAERFNLPEEEKERVRSYIGNFNDEQLELADLFGGISLAHCFVQGRLRGEIAWLGIELDFIDGVKEFWDKLGFDVNIWTCMNEISAARANLVAAALLGILDDDWASYVLEDVMRSFLEGLSADYEWPMNLVKQTLFSPGIKQFVAELQEQGRGGNWSEEQLIEARKVLDHGITADEDTETLAKYIKIAENVDLKQVVISLFSGLEDFFPDDWSEERKEGNLMAIDRIRSFFRGKNIIINE